MLLAKLIVDIDDLKDDYLAGKISEADFHRLRNARRQKFREDEQAQWERQGEEVRNFFTECRRIEKVRAGR